METINKDIVIIGSGLTGLTLAYLLRDSGKSVVILEGRDRIGGRIHTVQPTGGPPMEMGATWLGRKHIKFWQLLQELKIGVFEQGYSDRAIYEPSSLSPHQLVKLPALGDPSYRIQGGSDRVINLLASLLKEEQILTNKEVRWVRKTEHGVEVGSNTFHFKATHVVSTLPPFLLANSIDFTPKLPPQLVETMNSTNT